MTPKLSPDAYLEACDLASQCVFDAAGAVAFMAELVALRRLHGIARKHRRLPLALIRATEGLPEVADTAAWERATETARQEWEATQPGAPDLVQTSRRSA